MNIELTKNGLNYIVPVILWLCTIPFHNSEYLFLQTLSTVLMVLYLSIYVVFVGIMTYSVLTCSLVYKQLFAESGMTHEVLADILVDDDGDKSLRNYTKAINNLFDGSIIWSRIVAVCWFLGFVAVGWVVPAMVYAICVIVRTIVKIIGMDLVENLTKIFDIIDSGTTSNTDGDSINVVLDKK